MPKSAVLNGVGLIMLLCALAITPAACAATTATPGGRVFYVAPWGSDRNRGTEAQHPWRTVFRVNNARLRSGDTVLFAGGASFSDQILMPGWGFNVSGTARAPITFGSFGRGRARLTKGIWLGTNANHPSGPSHLTFRDLALGPRQGFQGTGSYIALLGLRITDLTAPYGPTGVGIETRGSHWLIANNQIDRTGDSGMLLGFSAGQPGDPPGGSDYLVVNNKITHTGLDRSLGYATHGIYLKVANATIERNIISYFDTDGVSARYRGARIVDNYLGHGSIGIAWYQYDTVAGTSQFLHNLIANTSGRGIFVCGVAESCARPIETFVIKGNRLRRTDGVQLQPTRGKYFISDNP